MKNKFLTLPLLTATLFAAAGIAAFAVDAAPEGAGAPPPAMPPGGPGGPGFGGHFREEMLKKFDQDGDGKLSDAERQAAREAMRAKWQERGVKMREGIIKRFDKDGDGKLNEAELGEAMKARREMQRHREHRMMRRHMMMMRFRHHHMGGGEWGGGPQGPGNWQGPRGMMGGPGGPGGAMREEFIKRFDKDGDGKLNEAERAEARKAGEEMREKFRGLRKEALARFDKNGDGVLDETERKALGDAWEKFISQQPAPAKPAGK